MTSKKQNNIHMKTVIKKAKIIDSKSPLNGKIMDILVVDGFIGKIDETITEKADEIIEEENLHVSIGWLDMFASFCDPGYEHKETLETGIQAAKSGGFTAVAIVPDTAPVISTKSQVEYILNKATKLNYEIIPYGSISQNMDGENISEFYDMFSSGAKGFTDVFHPISSELLSRALLYCKDSGGIILSFASDKSLSKNGIMHEGVESTKLGLKGIPALAEEIQIIRDLKLAEFNDSKIHFINVSTTEGVNAIREARKKGIRVTAQVSSAHLFLNDSSLQEFDSNNKVLPPFRTSTHINALMEGLKDGTIDCIVSSHIPQDIESKQVELTHAEFGIIGLETSFAVARTATKNTLEIEKLITKFTQAPREILGLEIPTIKEGEKANLTIFNPDKKWVFTKEDIKSKSKNTPFIGTEFTGKVVKVIC